MNRKYRVAVILVNFNSSQFTIDCIHSIYKTTAKQIEFETIVVDNNSETQSYEQLKSLKHHPNFQLIRSRINTGFSTACMLGVQHANADYYFFLNNDCILLNDCLGILTRFLDLNPKAALCSPLIYNTEGEAVTSFSYRPDILSKVLGNVVFRFTRRDSYVSRKHAPLAPVQVEVLRGSQLFVRAIEFERIGGFDTTLFLYCEEEDLSIRFWRAKQQIWLVPQARNSHVGGASTVQGLAINREFLISFFYLYRKHYGQLKTSLLKVIYALRYLRKSFRAPSKLSLVWFILSGSPMKASLRHQQTLSDPIESCQTPYEKVGQHFQ